MAKLKAGQWTVMLNQSAVNPDGRTLIAQPSDKVVNVMPGKKTKANFKLVSDEHGIEGHVRDSTRNPVPTPL